MRVFLATRSILMEYAARLRGCFAEKLSASALAKVLIYPSKHVKGYDPLIYIIQIRAL